MKYLKPNWYQINKAIDEGNIEALRKEQRSLEKSIQKKINQYYREERARKMKEHIVKIKALPVGASLYYTGYGSNGRLIFGDKFTKIYDGRTYVHVKLDRTGVGWRIPYENIIDRECTEQEIRDRKLGEKMSKIFNDAINI